MGIYNTSHKQIVLNHKEELIIPNNVDFFISIYNLDKNLIEKSDPPVCFNEEINRRYRFVFKTNEKKTISFIAYTYNDEIVFLSNVNNLEKYIINGEELKHGYIKWTINTFDLPENFELIITDMGCNKDLGEITYMVFDDHCFSFETSVPSSDYFIYRLL